MKYITLFILFAVSTATYAIYDPDPKTVPTSATADIRTPLVRASTSAPINGFSKMGIRCKYVKAGKFDPIVFPGQNNAGHHHTFFGNTGIAPGSTGQSLSQTGGSNCIGGSLARSGVWVPSTIDIRTNKFVAPVDVIVYYTASGRNDSFRKYIKPIPHGLKMLPKNNFIYHCFSSKGVAGLRSSSQFPVCNEPGGYLLYQLGAWPHCWDGKNLDSPDHKSHLASAFSPLTADRLKNPNECPSSHPVRIPQLNVFVTYRFNQAGETRYWRLASDSNSVPPGSTLHGDYMSGVNQNIQQVIIQNCLIANKDCSIGRLGVGFNNLLGSGLNGKLSELY